MEDIGMWRRQNRKRPSRAPLLRLPAINWSRIAMTVAALASLAGIYFGLAGLLNRPIDMLVINGSFQRVSAMQMEALVEPYARAGFLHTDLTAVRAALRALPWVAEADVRRRWPGTLVVNVTEETPVACWGERGLLNAAGELFLPQADHVPAELPRLNGPAGTEAVVTGRFFAVQKQLEHRGMAAVALALDARGAWTLRLNNGLEVRLGANGVDQRIGRFLQVLDGVLPQMSADVAYVDMRYPNGFAIGWKGQQAMQAATIEEPGPNA
jgi:cell division protein FtsQ